MRWLLFGHSKIGDGIACQAFHDGECRKACGRLEAKPCGVQDLRVARSIVEQCLESGNLVSPRAAPAGPIQGGREGAPLACFSVDIELSYQARLISPTVRRRSGRMRPKALQ